MVQKPGNGISVTHTPFIIRLFSTILPAAIQRPPIKLSNIVQYKPSMAYHFYIFIKVY